MKIEEFSHLAAFSVSGVRVPSDKAQPLLAARAEIEIFDRVLSERNPAGPPLAATREPTLSRVNYADGVRSEISGKWQRIAQEVDAIPPVRLLARLDQTWQGAEKEIGEKAAETGRKIFADRAVRKAEILEEEACRIASAQGLPAADRWLEALKGECSGRRNEIGPEVGRYIERKRRQSANLETLKEGWAQFLGTNEPEMGEVARRFLVLAGGALVVGLLLWFLAIPANSVISLALGVIAILLALRTAVPIFRRLWLSKRLRATAIQLVSAYQAFSLCGLYEATKRLEGDYYETLGNDLARIGLAYQRRIAGIRARRAAIAAGLDAQKEALWQTPATIKPLLRDEALDEWYQRGISESLISTWMGRLAALAQEPDWPQIEQEIGDAFAFVRTVRAEDELVSRYPDPGKQMEFLESLRLAALGLSDGEGFLALDFAAMQGRRPQVHLIVELEDPQNSLLAKAMQARWQGTGVGLSIERGSDPGEITLFGLVYGYSMGSQKSWNDIEIAFEQVKNDEGAAIYPVLFPENGGTRP